MSRKDLDVAPLDKQLGMETYASGTYGIGGSLRQTPEDFLVEEILVDGSRAKLKHIEHPETQVTGQGRYLICQLVKRNWDTLLAKRRIAKQLGVSEQRIRIAGMKDKRAMTAQYISIENIDPQKLKRIHQKDIHVYPLHYSSNMIFTHMIQGNSFRITIRNLTLEPTLIQERIEGTMEELDTFGGIPNFFGHQRFGTIRPITHLVGKALVQKDYEKAAMIFLARPSDHEHPQSREARERLLETLDFKEARESLPWGLVYEQLMLSHLVKRPKDFVGAFRRLPERLRRFFVQAYQSYLFNRFLSKRMLDGMVINEPQLGDYVVKADRHGLPSRTFTQVTASKLDSLRDVVHKQLMFVALPLIGYKQTLSRGFQGTIEEKILEDEEVKGEDFRLPSTPEMSATGELRAALTQIIDLNTTEPISDEFNEYASKIVAKFSLNRGSYATLVMREFMKPTKVVEAGF